MPTRLIICDDHPVVRSGLRGMLSTQADFELAAEAADGEQAVALVAAVKPDVVLMDLRLPVLDGAGAIARIRSAAPDTRVIVLTTYDSDRDILRAIEAGAIGYLLKDAPADDLFRAIRAAACGESILAPTVAAKLVQKVHAPQDNTLSEREIEVLRCVARGASNREIARELHVSEATIKTHLIHIYRKLDAIDRASAVMAAIRLGVIAP